MPRTLFGVKSASGSWWCERVCAPNSLRTLLCWQVEFQACHCHHGLALAGLWWEQEPHSSAVRRPHLGTWSVPQHSPAQCHLPLLSLSVTLPVPWSCSHAHSPALVTPARVPAGPAHGDPCASCAATSPPPSPSLVPPATPLGSPRLRGGSGEAPGLLPARHSRVCLTWPDKGAAVHSPSGTKPSLLERGRWRGRWDPAFPEGLDTALLSLPRLSLPGFTPCFFYFFFRRLCCPQGVTAVSLAKVPLWGHPLCHGQVPGCDCGDSGPGDTE